MLFKDSEAGLVIFAAHQQHMTLLEQNKPYIQLTRELVKSYGSKVKTLAGKKLVKHLSMTPMIMPELAKLVDRLEQPDVFPMYLGTETIHQEDMTTLIPDLEETNTRG